MDEITVPIPMKSFGLQKTSCQLFIWQHIPTNALNGSIEILIEASSSHRSRAAIQTYAFEKKSASEASRLQP
jgi:hypothetical protein